MKLLLSTLSLAAAMATAPAAQASAFAEVWNGGGSDLVVDSVPAGRASVSDTVTRQFPFTGDNWYYHASAYADGDRGTLGGQVTAGTLLAQALRPPIVHTYADLIDSVMFHGSGTALVDLTYTVNGSFESVGPAYFQADAMVALGSSSSDLAWRWLNSGSQPFASRSGNALVTELNNDPASLHATIHLPLEVTAGVWYDIYALLQLEMTPSHHDLAQMQFGHTARLGLELPDGWSFTSESGRLMTIDDEDVGALPEPPVLALLLAGWAVVGLRRGAHRARA
jgi:hypothetical protein